MWLCLVIFFILLTVGCVADHVKEYRCYFELTGAATFTNATEMCASESAQLTGVFNPGQLTWLSSTFTSVYHDKLRNSK